MRKVLRDNGLSLAFGLLFLLALIGQAFAGHADFNDRQVQDGGAPIGLGEYLVSSDFLVDVSENWQSEYLQFLLYVFATVYLIQRGSPESKPAGRIGLESDRDQLVGPHATARSPKWARAGGWRTAVYSRSLGLVMGGLFLATWSVQSVSGLAAYNSEQLLAFADPVGWFGYVGSADFWNRSLQNWQSEFLALGSMAFLSVYLRQRGSPESKPVGTPHTTTDETG
ncbi:DUF6766 family protein [Amycolatopsis albispora]|uniref:Uncharacterized protein n=1 Tax=Amycolatopsis albispora TaxID=1804986 RepID=A0A344LGU0_9PSEU|nr:DUF6766 family protein [Amycolatopsis albispora]AXB47264.1 hypothetical protein A4R43_36445 [Amycolatopsis albispora]